MHIADHGARIARVGGDHIGDILANFALVDNAHWGDADALAEHLFGHHVERARYTAADIGPMAVGLAVGDNLVADEYRADQPDIVEMSAAGIGIVDDVHIARFHRALEHPDDVLAGVMQRADMNGDVHISLRDGIAIGVVQR